MKMLSKKALGLRGGYVPQHARLWGRIVPYEAERSVALTIQRQGRESPRSPWWFDMDVVTDMSEAGQRPPTWLVGEGQGRWGRRYRRHIDRSRLPWYQQVGAKLR